MSYLHNSRTSYDVAKPKTADLPLNSIAFTKESATTSAVSHTTSPELTGDAALQAFLRGLDLKPGDQFLIASGPHNNKTMLATVSKVGLIAAQEIYKKCDYQPLPDARTYGTHHLRRQVAELENVSWLPSQQTSGRSKTDLPAAAPPYLYTEIDSQSLEDQAAFWADFEACTGLKPLLVFSGNKSLHSYFPLDFRPDWDWWTVAMRKLCAFANGDGAVVAPNHPMRLPGFPRLKNGTQREVTVTQWAGGPYSKAQIDQGFEYGWPHKHFYSEERWELRQAIERIQNNPTKTLPAHVTLASAFEYDDLDVLRKEIGIYKEPAKPQTSTKSPQDFSTIEALKTEIERALAGLGGRAYELSGFDFQFKADNYGRSPWSATNSSGRSFKISEHGWYCFASGNGGPNAAHFLIHYKYGQYPRGKEFIESLRWLADLAGVDPSALDKPIPPEKAEEWAAQYAQDARKAWDSCRTYTPTRTINQRYISIDGARLTDADIHSIKSDMGTGKTEALKRFLADIDKGAIALGSRNSLLLQSCERWGNFYHLHADNAKALIPDKNSRIACCIDSILNFKDEDFDGKVLILDEVTSVVKHSLRSATLKGRREKILAKLEQAIKRSAAVYALDGNNCDVAIDYLAELRGESARVEKTLNTHQASKLKVELILATDDLGKARRMSFQPGARKLQETLEAHRYVVEGRRAIAVIADSQRLCEKLEGIYKDTYRVLRIDSKTITQKWAKAFITSPNTYLAEHPQDLVILSPTAESGLDISIAEYFSQGFAFFAGILDTATQMQFLRRVRDCPAWAISCAEYSRKATGGAIESSFETQVAEQIQLAYEAYALETLNGNDAQQQQAFDLFVGKLETQLRSPHGRATTKFIAARNYELKNTRQCLQEALETAGHQVALVKIPVNPKCTVSAALSAENERIIEADSLSILNARDISLDEAAQLTGKFDASLDDRWASMKAFLKAEIPGIEHTEHWTAELIADLRFKNTRKLPAMKRYCMGLHIQAARRKESEQWRYRLQQGFYGIDIDTTFAQVEALVNKLGLFDLLDGKPRDKASKDICTIYDTVKRCPKLQAVIRAKPGVNESPFHFVHRLCDILGIRHESKQKPKAERNAESGKRQYFYSAPTESERDAAILKCIENRLLGNSPETQTQQGVEGGPTLPEISTKSGRVGPENWHDILLSEAVQRREFGVYDPAYFVALTDFEYAAYLDALDADDVSDLPLTPEIRWCVDSFYDSLTQSPKPLIEPPQAEPVVAVDSLLVDQKSFDFAEASTPDCVLC